MEMEDWVEFELPGGLKFLANLNVIAGVMQSPDGGSIAVTIAGAQIPLATPYLEIAGIEEVVPDGK